MARITTFAWLHNEYFKFVIISSWREIIIKFIRMDLGYSRTIRLNQ